MYKDFIKQISAPKNLGNEKLDQDKVDNLLCKLAEEKQSLALLMKRV